MTHYAYSADFYDYISDASIPSAHAIIPVVRHLLPINSILDVGCGKGAWLKAWQEHGVEILGVDKAVADDDFLIPAEKFISTNLSEKFNLGKRFDLVQCLEVAEHLPNHSAEGFVESLTCHGDAVLFSAAPPGQGGEHHINEQPYAYWREKFAHYGFDMYDIIRPSIKGMASVQPYYQYNIFLFVRRDSDQEKALLAKNKLVSPIDKPADISPIRYKIRKTILRLLPTFFVTRLSILKRTIQKLRTQV